MFIEANRRADAPKYTARIDVPLPEELRDGIIALAVKFDWTKTHYARWVLETHALGALVATREKAATVQPESRLGGQSGGDKCISRLDIPVTEELYDAVAALAGLAGRPKADYVRDILKRHVIGELAYVRARTRVGQ